MRTAMDVMRSLQIFVMGQLPQEDGEEYDIRIDKDEAAFARPMAAIRAPGDLLAAPTARYHQEKTLPFVIFVWPKPADTILESQERAWNRAELLSDAFAGAKPGTKPRRVPLFNWGDIGQMEPHEINDMIQTIDIGTNTGGTFKLRFAGAEVELDHDATGAEVQTALQARPEIGENIEVAGAAGGPYTVTFVNDLGGRVLGGMAGDGVGLEPDPRTLEITTTEGKGFDGYMAIRDPAIRVWEDPEDKSLWTITVNIRANWTARSERQYFQEHVLGVGSGM